MMQARPQTNPQSVKCNPENAERAKGCQNTTTGTTTVQQHQHNLINYKAYEIPGTNGSQSTTQGNNCTTEARLVDIARPSSASTEAGLVDIASPSTDTRFAAEAKPQEARQAEARLSEETKQPQTEKPHLQKP